MKSGRVVYHNGIYIEEKILIHMMLIFLMKVL